MSRRGQLTITPRVPTKSKKQQTSSGDIESYAIRSNESQTIADLSKISGEGRLNKNVFMYSSKKDNSNIMTAGENSPTSEPSNSDVAPDSSIKVADIIGDIGPYQIAVILFAALRAMCCAMDGLSGPFISPNIKNYQCEICDHPTVDHDSNVTIAFLNDVCTLSTGPSTDQSYELDRSSCQFTNAISSDRIPCNKWSFYSEDNQRLMNTLTVEQSLICDREWMKSLSNSMYFVGATFGLLFWGIISDRFGRKKAYVISHFVTLIFGFSALFATSMRSFILLRAINAFGMIGELIPRSVSVEMVATRYRFVSSTVCQIGWATGIILVPVLSYINPSYRFILASPVVISALMIPWLIWLPESARWLIINNHYAKARNELIRAARLNGKLTDDIDSLIERYNRQVLHEEESATGDQATTINDGTEDDSRSDSARGLARYPKRMGVWRSIVAIFTNVHLLKDTLSVFLLLFVAEVVYFSLTLNVADLSGSLYVNFIVSGLSELVSIAFCSVMLAYLSRRTCLSVLLLASTVSYLLMALVNVYEDSLSMTLILSVNAFGKLTAIGNLMVIILVSQEVFPTVIRQFGTSLCITVGKAGSAVAPFTHELGQVIGQSYCFAMFSLVCLTCALIPFGLSETGNRELPDTVIDMEEGDNENRRRKLQKQLLLKAKNSQKPSQYLTCHPVEGTLQDSKANNNLHCMINRGDANNISTTEKELSILGNDRSKQANLDDDPNNNCLDSDQNKQTLFISRKLNCQPGREYHHNQVISDPDGNTNNEQLHKYESGNNNNLGTTNNHQVGDEFAKPSSTGNLSCDNTIGTSSYAGSSSDISTEQEQPDGKPVFNKK